MSDILPDQDLDLSFLYEIADGSEEFIIESITMFLEQTPELLGTITSAIAAQDWITASTALHKLKPNLGYFGMTLSQANMQDVELMCKEAKPDDAAISAKFDNIKSVVNANLILLEKIRLEKIKRP